MVRNVSAVAIVADTLGRLSTLNNSSVRDRITRCVVDVRNPLDIPHGRSNDATWISMLMRAIARFAPATLALMDGCLPE
jgi:hypothetical protein